MVVISLSGPADNPAVICDLIGISREGRAHLPSDYCCMGAGCSNPDVCNDEIGRPCGVPDWLPWP